MILGSDMLGSRDLHIAAHRRGSGPEVQVWLCVLWEPTLETVNAQGLQTKWKGGTASHGWAVRHACQLFLQTGLKFSLLRKESLILTALAGIRASSKKTVAVFVYLVFTVPPLKLSEWWSRWAQGTDWLRGPGAAASFWRELVPQESLQGFLGHCLHKQTLKNLI